MASAPNVAAAKREFSLRESLNELNICRPLFAPCAPVSGASLAQTCTGQAFRDVCTKSPKWFRRGKELFL
jgi:hypothetical protein